MPKNIAISVQDTHWEVFSYDKVHGTIKTVKQLMNWFEWWTGYSLKPTVKDELLTLNLDDPKLDEALGCHLKLEPVYSGWLGEDLYVPDVMAHLKKSPKTYMAVVRRVTPTCLETDTGQRFYRTKTDLFDNRLETIAYSVERIDERLAHFAKETEHLLAERGKWEAEQLLVKCKKMEEEARLKHSSDVPKADNP